MRHLTYADILEQEEEVEAFTTTRLSGFFEYVRRALDLFIQLAYHRADIADLNTDHNRFKSAAQHWWYLGIYTFEAATLLMRRGLYLESQILHRNLVEVLGKLRYFDKHPEQLFPHESSSGPSRQKIKWKTIFDEVFPGFYDQYRRVYCRAAHGGIGVSAYKAERVTPDNRNWDAGVIYKEFWASSVMNQTVLLLLGYIGAYRIIFADHIAVLPQAVRSELDAVEHWLQQGIEAHVKLHGGENEWHRATRAIWKN